MLELKAATGLTFEGVKLGDGPAEPAPADEGTSSKWVPDTVDQLQSLAHQVSKIGFVKDAWVAKKDSASVCLWQLALVEDSGVEMVEHGTGTFQSITIQSLMSEWRVHKGKVTLDMPGWTGSDSSNPLSSESWGFDVSKGAISLAIRAEFEKHVEHTDNLRLTINPYMVYSKVDIEPGQLKLVAASSRIDRKSAPNVIGLGTYKLTEEKSAELFLSPQHVTPQNKDGEPNKAPWVAPFWVVRHVDNAKQANLKLDYVVVNVFDIDVNVPFYTNTKAVKGGDELTCVVCKVIPQPASERKKTPAKRQRVCR